MAKCWSIRTVGMFRIAGLDSSFRILRMVEELRTHKVCLLLNMRTYHCHLSQNEGHLQMGRGGYKPPYDMHLNIWNFRESWCFHSVGVFIPGLVYGPKFISIF